MKAANSIVRNALRDGLFRGKSKQLYDFLYSRTRGAIVPKKSVRLRRSELTRGSNIGSLNTLRDNLRHLRSVGLVNWTEVAGEQYGNVYTVFLPEEAQLPFDLEGNPVQAISPVQSTYTDQSDRTAQNVVGAPSAESGQSGQSASGTDAASYEAPKTSVLRQVTIDDDDALADLAKSFRELNREITGRDVSPSDRDRWRELAEVLSAELKIAAARTTISSVPAFLAEHLRRRLWKIDKKQARAEGRELPDQTVPTSVPLADAKACPDCAGSGWWYPDGQDRGVRKCKHERLKGEKGA